MYKYTGEENYEGLEDFALNKKYLEVEDINKKLIPVPDELAMFIKKATNFIKTNSNRGNKILNRAGI